MKSVALYFQEGSSDKVYNVALLESGSGYVVNFSFGRRGTALATGTKTQSPVNLEAANKIFDKLVKEKSSKGYKPMVSDSGIEVQHQAPNESGIRCQLLNPIERHEALALLMDDRYLAQEKHDSRRLLIRKLSDKVEGINRTGLTLALHPALAGISKSPIDFIVDGEDMGEGEVILFDALEYNGNDLRNLPTTERLEWLSKIVHAVPLLSATQTALSTADKTRLFEKMELENKEGVVFKLKTAPYSPGRPASGGPHLKFKFYETASFIVQKINNKRSGQLGLINTEGAMVDAGNVTIPANHDIPKAGDIVEVRYLYAYRESGSVYQPVYLGKRDDITQASCTTNQLKYKNAVSSTATEKHQEEVTV